MERTRDDDMAICTALSCYAAYTTFNIYRSKGITPSVATAVDAMKQSIFQAASGSKELGKFLDNRWRAPIRTFHSYVLYLVVLFSVSLSCF